MAIFTRSIVEMKNKNKNKNGSKSGIGTSHQKHRAL